jgi:hypothetical protein
MGLPETPPNFIFLLELILLFEFLVYTIEYALEESLWIELLGI